MKNKLSKKSLILIGLVILLGIVIAGGTFAYLYVQASINNNNYQGNSTCFLIDYGNTQAISGTLFPSAGPNKGLSGSVTLKINDSCSTTGKGTLYLHVNNTTSTKFGDTVDSHCENPNTFITLPEYTASSDCNSNGGIWVGGSTALKFLIYDNNTFTGTPLAVGNFYNELIGNDVPIYSGFDVTSTTKTLYIYVWLDGYTTDNTYVNLPFDAYIWASAVQNENILPNTYEQVEYIHFSGSEYIDTGVKPSTYSGNYQIEIKERHAQNADNMYVMGTNALNSQSGSRANIRIDANGVTCNAYVNTSSNSGALGIGTTTGLVVNSVNYIKYTVNSTNSTRELFANGNTTFSDTSSFVSLGTNNWRIGGCINAASFVGDIYSVKIYGNGTLVRDFIPCYRKSDGVLGFYDAVSGNFFTNASGTGALTTNIG